YLNESKTSHYILPWDTFRIKSDNQTYYDSLLPYADKATYSLKAFTKKGYWSKNEADKLVLKILIFRKQDQLHIS
ncbi:MAG: hypothetical protein ACOCXH_10740, partial [Cyclobacteriaceae bacterium]